mmetsp:Transcript_32922/g.87336  ORF Transcript_32922/g.87336 Transcript_32922/m.87336 type:complete len:135 (-) Transcript_32922:165-569(-)
MDEALCTWTSSPPVFSQSCYGISDCGFQYVVGDWSECSTDCGNGYRSRPLTCLRDDGVAVDLSQCQQLGLPAPDTQMHCAAVAGCTYTVVPGGWGPCSVECLQYRELFCYRSDGTLADLVLCGPRPVFVQDCCG